MRLNRWLVVGLACIGIVLILGLIKFMQIRAAIAFGNSFPEPSETVEVVRADLSEWQQKITVTGNVRASREVEMRTELGGRISKIGFTPGGPVSAGDILLQLDTAEEQAQLAAIRPEIALAELEFTRFADLVGKNAVSRQQYDRAKSALAIAKAQAASVRETIANKTIIAPFDGIAGIHDFEVGQVVSANSVVTNLIGGLDKLWVDFSLPQQYAQLAMGTPVLIDVDGDFGTSFTAIVNAVEPRVSSTTRSVRSRAELVDLSGTIKPGSIVRVTVPVGAKTNAFRIASTAVRRDSFGNYVFILNKDDKGAWRAARKPVEVSVRANDYSIITSGLEVGDTVATLGSFKLRQGIWVKIAEQQSLSPANTEPQVINEPSVEPQPEANSAESPILPDSPTLEQKASSDITVEEGQ